MTNAASTTNVRGYNNKPLDGAPSLIHAPKVIVAKSTYGDGAFAKEDIKEGELIEQGLMRRIPVDGNKFEMCFTWSDDRTVWATASGPAMFYNTSLNANTNMTRIFDEDRFEIYAKRDIKAGEALTHQYRSLKWRKCFSVLPQPEESKENANANGAQDTQSKKRPVSPSKLLGPEDEPPSKIPKTDGTDEAKDDFYEKLPRTRVTFPKVHVKPDGHGGHGCFAACDILEGDCIERGIVRIAPVDGNECPSVFMWGDKWAVGSGCSMFYNHSEDPNVGSFRDYQTMSFNLLALTDIKEGEELTHRYHSIAWRNCFADLRQKLNKTGPGAGLF